MSNAGRSSCAQVRPPSEVVSIINTHGAAHEIIQGRVDGLHGGSGAVIASPGVEQAGERPAPTETASPLAGSHPGRAAIAAAQESDPYTSVRELLGRDDPTRVGIQGSHGDGDQHFIHQCLPSRGIDQVALLPGAAAITRSPKVAGIVPPGITGVWHSRRKETRAEGCTEHPGPIGIQGDEAAILKAAKAEERPAWWCDILPSRAAIHRTQEIKKMLLRGGLASHGEGGNRGSSHRPAGAGIHHVEGLEGDLPLVLEMKEILGWLGKHHQRG